MDALHHKSKRAYFYNNQYSIGFIYNHNSGVTLMSVITDTNLVVNQYVIVTALCKIWVMITK